MSDTMQLLSFRQLLTRIFEEYRAEGSIFGLHHSQWYRPAADRRAMINRESCTLPLGPAAGPHTQLAQNIVTAYLAGSRFFELKTVQILDRLEIEKPCIDAADEAYNTEWSTELSLDGAWQEYARAWITLHLIDVLWGEEPADRSGDVPSFIFNMSVGYDLEGIKQPAMQRYLAAMTAPTEDERYRAWLADLPGMLPELLAGTGFSPSDAEVERVLSRASQPICRSVTLSTMHGCPPGEIESICRYMLDEQQLDTFVKLNPTLLGYDTARQILTDLGYDYVSLKRESFTHDLQFPAAVAMVRRLQENAARRGRGFGVKLTNTLPVVNNRGALPGEEMYLSGRALYPLSIGVAAALSRELEGTLPISFCGGVTVHNAQAILAVGIRPLTLSTDLLKPGGYGRLAQIASEIESAPEWNASRIDVEGLTTLAAEARRAYTAHKRFRGTDAVEVPGDLPVTDCYRAPCVEACPIEQHVPEYIRLVGEGRYAEALALIYERNALPAVTGYICDHQCQAACTRLDYEGCLNIRELKRIAVERGGTAFRAARRKPEVTRAARCAVVGAGPAGLSAAFFSGSTGFCRDHL